MSKCHICNIDFVKKEKNYDRYRITSFASPRTLQKAFNLSDERGNNLNNYSKPDSDSETSSYTPTPSDYLCGGCLSQLRARTVPKNGRSGRRTTKRKWIGTPKKRTPQKTTQVQNTPSNVTHTPKAGYSPLKKRKRTGPCPSKTLKSDVCDAIQKYQYQKAFRLLAKRSKSAKQALISVCSELIKSENKEIRSSQTKFSTLLTLEAIEDFSWTDALDQVEEIAPVTMGTLKSIFPPAKRIIGQRTLGRNKEKRKETLEEAENRLAARVGTALSVALFTVNPKKFKFLPSAVGVEMWRQGTTQKALTTLNQMGISLGTDATRGHVDRLRKFHDREILVWKSEIEKKPAAQPTRRRLEMNIVPAQSSYGVCWDNVQIDSEAKHQSLERANSFLMWGMTLGVSHRVPTLHLSKTDTIPAVDVPASAFIPTSGEYEQLRQHMEHLVVLVLGRNLDSLKHIKLEHHMPHAHTEEMNRKSDVVNLGVIEGNPSSTDGCSIIMEHLMKYVPKLDDKVQPILCSGDGLSVERMVSAHRARVNGETSFDRLDGLVESPQEFHKEIILLQDYMDLLFKGTSASTEGTLFQMKNNFSHKSLAKDVKTNVQQVWDMLQFSTDAYIVLAAMKLRDMPSIADIPASFPAFGSTEEQKDWIRCLAAEIVDFCWLPPSAEDLETVTQSLEVDQRNMGNQQQVFPYCCHEVKEDDMIRCCSWACSRKWLHITCTELLEVPGDDEAWFCSDQCRQDGSQVYCFCHRQKGGDMVQCCLENACHKYEWYHLQCIDASRVTDGNWYCSDDCALGIMQDDPVLNHSKTLMWLGLNSMTRRDAVREGNGTMVIAHWKMDMIQFWNRSHPKYLIIAHQLLANVGGHKPENIREDLIWNRLCNLKGRPGGNIGLDLVNEFLNCDFKEMLKHSRGRYTDDQVARCAQMGGAFGRHIDRLFTLASLGQYDSRDIYKRPNWYQEDIRVFTEEYEEHALLDYIPGREPDGFTDFVFDQSIKSPWKLGQKLKTLSQDMDTNERLGRRLPQVRVEQ